MGIRSDVFVGLKEEVFSSLKEQNQKFLLEQSDMQDDRDGGKAFLFSGIKWYKDTFPELIELYGDLEHSGDFNSEDYIIIEACEEYPTMDATSGGWEDNPWNAFRYVEVSIHADGFHTSSLLTGK